MEFLEDGFMFPMGDSSIPPMGDSYMPQMSNWFMPPMSDSFIPPMSECYMPQIGDNFMLPMGANFMLPNSDCYMDSAVIENEAAFQPNYEDILNTISGQIDMEQASGGIQKQQIIRKAPLGRGMYMQNTVTVPNMGHVQMDLAGNNIGWVDERSRQGNQQQFAQPHANEQRTNERRSADLPGARDVAEVCCADPECLLEICSCIFQSCCCCAEQ